MSPSKPNDFGASLRIAREGRELTLRDISETTRISIGALQALEQNDIARLPGRFYSRSFVRAYAREVGLDPAATVEVFLDAFPEQRPDGIEEPRDTPRGSERVASRRDFDRTAVSLALITATLFFTRCSSSSSSRRCPSTGSDRQVDQNSSASGSTGSFDETASAGGQMRLVSGRRWQAIWTLRSTSTGCDKVWNGWHSRW